MLSSLTNFYDFKYDAPYFCGGIPDIFKLLDHETYAWGDKTLKASNTFRENSEIYSRVGFPLKNIYLKNSHLGMILPEYYFSNTSFLTNKTKMAYKILFLIFISICF